MAQVFDTCSQLRNASRVVIKIGSALLVDGNTGQIGRPWLNALADDVARLHKRGQQVILVSSGAIAVGRHHLGLSRRQLRLQEKQAAAATGQGRLAHAYQEALDRHDLTAAQVLLTLDDTESRRRYLNARNTLDTLLDLAAVPVINENDTTATEEIRFGDNDRLAARVAAMLSADALILLSDIDGLYSDNPKTNPQAQHLPVIHHIDDHIRAMAGQPTTTVGTGGMITKLMAADIAMGAGCTMYIARGDTQNPIAQLENGARCTAFIPASSPRTARKHWIAGTLKPKGTLIIDSGAKNALGMGKSLLPAGLVAVQGMFNRGEAVIVQNPEGQELGRGIVAYSSEEAQRLTGCQSREIESRIGYQDGDELIHRDDLALNQTFLKSLADEPKINA